ncbi:hypothetical protein B0H19DRAFT_301850 [Mycena capillaripes]|nr:hypothetical protein B0H19DRAFT_301850 [Mycena capillaripes]
MDDEPRPNQQSKSESTSNDIGSATYPGAFFPNSQNFTITGGVFNSIHHAASNLPDDFRRIPLGDIDLRREICIRLDRESGVVNRPHVRNTVRRMYSARVGRRKPDMSVILYEGNNAEEQSRQYISRHSSIRHPNFIQIFGVARSFGIHAIVAHDNLMTYKDFLEFRRPSSSMRVYLYACWGAELLDAKGYFERMFLQELGDLTFWIRRSTGRPCIELVPSDIPCPNYSYSELLFAPDTLIEFDDPNSEARVMESLDIEKYHDICSWHLSQTRNFSTRAQAELNPGAVMDCPASSQLEDSMEIAVLTSTDFYAGCWVSDARVVGKFMEDGWIRYTIHLFTYLELADHIQFKFQIPRDIQYHSRISDIRRLCFRLLARSSKSHFWADADYIKL